MRAISFSKAEIFAMQFPLLGDPARIIDGPFAGIEGTVVKRDVEKELFVVSVELLQRSVAIKLKRFQITKL
jgi:transcription antitermination factor NusG